MNQNPPYVPVKLGQAQDDEIDIVGYLDVLLANRWLIAGVAGAVLVLGIAYAFLTRPIYEADIMVQVEDSPTDAKSLLGDVSSLFDVKTQAAAEIEILRSRMVVGKAVENLKLYIEAKPKRFPLIGDWIARRNKGLSQPGLFGFGGYTWGAESIKVSLFDVPEELHGEKFVFLVLGNGRFRITQDSLDNPIEGRVGEPVTSSQSVGTFMLLVPEIKAKPGAQFVVTRKSSLGTLEDLQDDLKILERGKQSGIIGASLEGENPILTAEILNEIGSEYVAQNIKRKAAEAEKSLVFLNGLLPELKSELERAEVKYNEMRNKRGTFDLSEEAKAFLQESVATETNLQELKQKKAELVTRFAPGHPALQAIDQQMAALNVKMSALQSRVKTLPNLEQDTLRLMRDVQVNNDLYVGLLNNMQQLKLVKAGKVGNVRLVDSAAVPEEPLKPKKKLIALLAAVVGLLLGIVVAFIKNSLYGGITDPQDIEEHTGLSVYGTIPLSKVQLGLAEQIGARKPGCHLLATSAANDPSVESLRSLRTSLQFAMLDAPNNRVLLTGPTPGVGKSFVSVNLAAVMAAAGKRVLLIDADMRKGYLNQYFGKNREPGLADVLANSVQLSQAIQKNVVERLDFIPTGMIPPNPAELVLSHRLKNLLDDLSNQYDLVLIDTPPVLAVSDTTAIAAICGTVFLVTRSERSTIGEVAETAKSLKRANVEVKGVIFNGLNPEKFRYGYGSKYGRYRYAYYGYASQDES